MNISAEKNTRYFAPGWILGIVLFLCCFPAPLFARDPVIKIFVTTDVHGYVAEDRDLGHIGFAALKGYIDAARGKGATTFLLDSGDMVSGSMYAKVDHGKSVARLMGMTGYNGMVPGNHEFDFNAAERDPLYFFQKLVPIMKESGTGPFTATAVNIRYQGTAPPNMQVEPFILYDETPKNPDGLRIIVAGVTVPVAVRAPNPRLLDAYDFGAQGGRKKTREHILTLLGAAVEQYSRANDIVIVLSHLGYSEKRAKAKKNLITGKDLATVPNVDFVLDGHAHGRIHPEKIQAAWYAQGGRYLRNFTEITLAKQKDGTYGKSMRLRSIKDTEAYRPSPEIANAVSHIARQYDLDKKVLHLSASDSSLLFRQGIRSGSRPVGNLITGAMRLGTGAHFAACSANAFRTDMLPRHLTVADVYDMIPFAGSLMTGTIRGQDVERLFARLLLPETGSFPQFAGLTMSARQNAANPSAPYSITDIRRADGAPLEPDKEYTIAFNSRMFAGNLKAEEYIKDIRDHGELWSFLARYWENTPEFPWRECVYSSPLVLRE